MKRSHLLLIAAPLLALAATGVTSKIKFQEVGAKSGTRVNHHTRRFAGPHGDVLRMFTSGGAAVAVGDYDGDGFDDLFVTDSDAGKTSHLFHNNGDMTFTEVTAKAGVGGGNDPKSIVADALWFDYDNDGLLDLFVSNYVQWNPLKEKPCGPPEHRLYCHPDNYGGTPNQLFHNNGDGTFTDVSQSSGIASHIGKGMGVSFADFDGDGFTDVFVANDSMRNFLFRNKGNGKFEEVGLP